MFSKGSCGLPKRAAWQGEVTTVRKDCPSQEAKRGSQMASREGTAHVNGRPPATGHLPET